MKQYTKNSAELLLEYLHEGLDVNYIDHENVGRTLLHKACLHRCWDMPGSDLVRTLIDFDADVNAKDDNGDTPLHLACTNIDKDTVDEDIIQLLVENGADPNAKNNEGDVAWIGLAYSYRHLASLWHLLAHGADVNSRGWYGLTALHGASSDAEVAKLLLENGADLHLVDMRGWTPLHKAWMS